MSVSLPLHLGSYYSQQIVCDTGFCVESDVLCCVGFLITKFDDWAKSNLIFILSLFIILRVRNYGSCEYDKCVG